MYLGKLYVIIYKLLDYTLNIVILDSFMLGVKHYFITVYGDIGLSFLVIGHFFPFSNTQIATVNVFVHASRNAYGRVALGTQSAAELLSLLYR